MNRIRRYSGRQLQGRHSSRSRWNICMHVQAGVAGNFFLQQIVRSQSFRWYLFSFISSQFPLPQPIYWNKFTSSCAQCPERFWESADLPCPSGFRAVLRVTWLWLHSLISALNDPYSFPDAHLMICFAHLGVLPDADILSESAHMYKTKWNATSKPTSGVPVWDYELILSGFEATP